MKYLFASCLAAIFALVPRGSNSQQESLLSEEYALLPASSSWGAESFRVVPGQLDEKAKEAYLNGQCIALAVAICNRVGGKILLARSEAGQIIHAGAEIEPGVVCDINGRQDISSWLEDPRFCDPDDPIEGADEIEPAEALALPDFPKQVVSVAETFVWPALEI